jgi:hypothetical protein
VNWPPAAPLFAPAKLLVTRASLRGCERRGLPYLTSSPVTARPMIMRWISDVPSKMVKIVD